MPTWQKYLEEQSAVYLTELLDFVRIPSISSLPEHVHSVAQAADWVATRMERAGIENVQIMPTEGHPVVYGDWLHAPGAPTVMIYGHFDTQPADPLDLWDHPPFEPHVEGEKLYGRGASDDKGNMLAPILATEALLETEGRLPVNVKFFFEGQEEIGSPNMPPFIAQHKELLACDMVISADGGQWAEDQPELTVGLRGLCALQIDVVGPNRDLHSGQYGGAVANPIHALAQILSSMRSEDGKIQVAGFYDDVRPLSDADRAQIAAVPHDDEEYHADLEVDALHGEPGFSTLERIWARPTLEVNGIWGGFSGAGTKTVLPSAAHAKITCRLVPDQEPEEIAARVEAHVQQVAPPGVKVTVQRFASKARPYRLPQDHPGNAAARAVLLELYGKEPYYTRSGGSIPVCELFLTHLNAYTVVFAFGLPDENVHSPNEFFRLSSFRRGQQGYCMLLHQLAESAPQQ
jgi:acetylornithine deacetylase/succinyl-diaminopimelate desuccinylase-like protein